MSVIVNVIASVITILVTSVMTSVIQSVTILSQSGIIQESVIKILFQVDSDEN